MEDVSAGLVAGEPTEPIESPANVVEGSGSGVTAASGLAG